MKTSVSRLRLGPGAARIGVLLLGASMSGACLIPEYHVDDGEGDGDGGNDGIGGGTQSSSGGGSLVGDGGGSSDGGTGGDSDTGGSDAGGTDAGGAGGAPPAWSCDDEMSDLPRYYSNGVWCGYRFTFIYPWEGTGAPTVSPPCTDRDSGTDCFDSAHPHLVGELPAFDSAEGIYPMLGMGMTVAGASSGNEQRSWTVEGHGITVDYSLEGVSTPVRIQIKGDGGEYCANALSGTPLAWEDFRFECWNTTNTQTLQPGDAIDEVLVAIPSIDVPLTIDKLDIDSLTFLEEAPEFTCDGCAVLSVQLEGADDNESSEFVLDLGGAFDLSGGGQTTPRVVARVFIETDGNAGGLQLLVRSGGGPAYYLWSSLGYVTGWYDLVVVPSAVDGENGFDATAVTEVGFAVSSGEALSGEMLGDTTVYIDSVRFEDAAAPPSDFTFSDSEGELPIMTTGTLISEVGWQNY